jgi:hypothetical protein
MAISALAAMALPASALGSTAGRPLTPGQIRAAVLHAERSHHLWATINICDTHAYPDRIGIRGQMPALGFAARLEMRIQVDYWVPAAKRFRPVPGSGARSLARLGTVVGGLQQSGHTFHFKPGSGRLSGTITFRWTRTGKVIGQISKRATGGHRGVDRGSPPHHSAATCTIR